MKENKYITQAIEGYRYWQGRLALLRKEARQEGLSRDEKKEINRQKRNIIGSVITTIGVAGFCFVSLLSFLSVILYEKNSMKLPEKTTRELEIIKFKDEYPEIYNRVRYEHGDMYLLSKDISEYLETTEEKILAVYQYVRERVQYLNDSLPKPMFFFPDETLAEKKGNSKEQAVLAASLLYFMNIETQLILDGTKTYLCVENANSDAYKNAITKLVEENYIFFEDYLTVERKKPEMLIIPERLDGLNVFIGFDSKYPIDIIAIGEDIVVNEKCSRKKVTSGVIECSFNYGDKITLIADEHPLVEVLITISTHRNEIIKMMPQTDKNGQMDIYLDFTNKNIKALSGNVAFNEEKHIRLPIIPELLW